MDGTGNPLFKVLFFVIIGLALLSCRLPVMLYAALLQGATATPTITQTGTATNTSTVTVTLSPTMTQAPPPLPTLMAPSETPLPIPTQPRQPTPVIYTSAPYGLNKPSLVRPSGPSGRMRPWYEWLPVNGAYVYMIWVWRLDIKGNKTELILNEQHQAANLCNSSLCQFHPDLDLTENKNYVWQIQAYGSAGYSPLSDPMTFQATKLTEASPTITRTMTTVPPPKTSTPTRTLTSTPVTPTQTVAPNPLYEPLFKGSCSSGASVIRVDPIHNNAYLVSQNIVSVFDLPPSGINPSPIAAPVISVLPYIYDLDYGRSTDNEVYLAGYESGFVKVNDITTVPIITTPVAFWTPTTKGNVESVALVSDENILVGTNNGVRRYFSTLTEKQYFQSGEMLHIMVDNDGSGNVYLSTGTGGLKIWNCSGVASCGPIGSITVPGSAYGSYVVTNPSDSKKYAYVAAYSQGLRIYDITIPGSPVTKGSFVCAGCIAKGVVVDDNAHYAYVALGNKGLMVVDVSNPLLPKPAYEYTGINVQDLDVDSNTLYAAVDDTHCFWGFDLVP